MIALWLLGSALAAPCTRIEGGTVYLPSGPRTSEQALLLEDGVITSVDAGPRPDCERFDARGKHVVPGLVAATTQLGLVEINAEAETVHSDGGGDAVRAALRVVDAYDARSTLIPIERREGITSAVTWPSGGLISGQGAWVDLTGQTRAQAVVSPSVGMLATVVWGTSRATSLESLRELFEDARDFRANRAAWERNQRRAYAPGAGRHDLQALGAVLDGDLPLVVGAERAADIESLLALHRELRIRMVISGGSEAWMHAEALARAGIPVIVDPLVYGPGSFDQTHARVDNAKILAEAGVDVILSNWWTHNVRTLRQSAGNAVRAGMDHTAALNAITETPARVFGAFRHGRIAPGAIANVVVFDGDPLEVRSGVEQVWIGGVAQPLTTRQTALRDRYRTLPGSPVPGLPLPE